MRAKWMGVAVAAVMGCWVQQASAAFIIDFEEVGGQVTVTGSGTIDLSGLTEAARGSFSQSDLDASTAALFLAPGNMTVSDVVYAGIIGPSSFGPLSALPVNASMVAGDPFIFSGQFGAIGVSPTFTGGALSFTATLDASDLVAAGLSPNTRFDYTLGSTPDADTLTVIVGPSIVTTVPVPGSAPLFGTALLALGGLGYASRRRVGAPSQAG